MKHARLGDLLAGQSFTTLLTNRRGSIIGPAQVFTDAVFVAFADGERKSLHKDVQVGYHWVN